MTEQLKNGILELLPQIPFVVDQVDEAFKWAEQELNEGQYNKMISKTYEVAKYTSKVSESNFFKTHLVVASILSEIPNVQDDKRFEKFDTASKAVESTLNKIRVNEGIIKERGCFKALLMHIVPLAQEDQDCFAIMLYGILNDLKDIVSGMNNVDVKTPITQKDYIAILGYAYVVSNIYMSNLNLLMNVSAILNEISIILNSLNY